MYYRLEIISSVLKISIITHIFLNNMISFHVNTLQQIQFLAMSAMKNSLKNVVHLKISMFSTKFSTSEFALESSRVSYIQK